MALKNLADQRGFQIVFATQDVASIQTDGAVGELTSNEALKRLLLNTGLTYHYLDDKTVTISRTASRGNQDAATVHSLQEEKKEGGKSSSQDFRTAQVAQAGTGTEVTHAGGGRTTAANTPLEEIVVTAQKREERLLSVPAPVTALLGSDLAREQSVRMQDYASKVPGLTVVSDQAGELLVVMRGITTGSLTSSTTAMYIDESPFGSSTNYSGGGFTAPDLDPGSLERIEVLRGPQGTLYGASSLGGLIKFVSKSPSLTEFSGRVEVDGSSVDGGGNGYGVRALIGGPIIENTLGFTLSGFDRRDPGYTDNVYLGSKNVDSARLYGGRLAVLWQPITDFSVELSVLSQDSHTNGESTEDLDANLKPIEGSLKQVRYVTEPADVRDRLYSATINYDLGVAKLLSVTSYQTFTAQFSNDLTTTLGPVIPFFFPNVLNSPITSIDNGFTRDKISQEFRVASPVSTLLEWQGGLFFTHESSRQPEFVNAFDSITRAPLGLAIFQNEADARYTEYAAFGDVTYHFTSAFDILAGIRYSKNKQDFVDPSSGALAGGSIVASGTSSDHSVTYLFTPQYQIDPNNMLYVRIASGYRPGGPNNATAAQLALGVPATFKPDKLTNYELGYKASLFDKKLTVDASVFDIEWKDIQVTQIVEAVGVIGNASSARSKGLEAAFTFLPFKGLNLAANFSYTHAYLTEDAPGVNGRAGDDLPYVPKFAANVSADYDFPIMTSFDGFVGASFQHQGRRESLFVTGSPADFQRPALPAYHTFDVRAGVKHTNYEFSLYAKNLADSRGLTNLASFAFDGYDAPYHGTVIRPRTIGASLTVTF